MANISKLLYDRNEECFCNEITPDNIELANLETAKTKIRNRLKTVFSCHSEKLLGAKISPKFFTQGSYSYKTLNYPAFPPEQQMDLDDGCYLPLSFVQGHKPSRAATAFFEFVDNALKVLAQEEGWQFSQKPTCARLIITSDAHIDIPLYAIPDEEFILLKETASMHARDNAVGNDARPDSWEALPSEAVLLAHRIHDWMASDPRKIRIWYANAIKLYGERLRRVCRYMKAWRDHKGGELDKVSSILLMICAFNAFEECGVECIPERDDEALLLVVDRLPVYLSGTVTNPAEPSENVNRIPDEDRSAICAIAKSFASELRLIIKQCKDAEEAVRKLKEALGSRVPDRPDLVRVSDALTTIYAQPKKEMPAPVIGRSTSG